jgi:hypothetical protein
MLINPAYLVDLRGQTVLYLKKQPAFFEAKFTLDKRGDFSDADEKLLLPSLIMLLLLERSRGQSVSTSPSLNHVRAISLAVLYDVRLEPLRRGH